jgi:hypothetical protein
MRKGFTFYASYATVAARLEDKDRLAFYDALIAKEFTGADPVGLSIMAEFAYESQKHSIEKQVVGYERAKNVVLSENEPPLVLPYGSPLGSPPKEEEEKGEEEEKEEEEEEEKEKDWSHKIFNDSIFIEQLNRMNKGKDIRAAWDECYLFHMNSNKPPEDLKGWKQKLISWLSNVKVEERKNRLPDFI